MDPTLLLPLASRNGGAPLAAQRANHDPLSPDAKADPLSPAQRIDRGLAWRAAEPQPSPPSPCEGPMSPAQLIDQGADLGWAGPTSPARTGGIFGGRFRARTRGATMDSLAATPAAFLISPSGHVVPISPMGVPMSPGVPISPSRTATHLAVPGSNEFEGMSPGTREGGCRVQLSTLLQQDVLWNWGPILATLFFLQIIGGLLFGMYHEGWEFPDALYWTVTTMTTVGSGEKSPPEGVGRVFDIFFIFTGMCITSFSCGVLLSAYREGSKPRSSVFQFVVLFCQLAVSVAIGAVVMSYLEGWDGPKAAYWAWVTATTVGYGDVSPEDLMGKYFASAYVLFSTALVARAIGKVVSLPVEWRTQQFTQLVLEQFGEQIQKVDQERMRARAQRMGMMEREDGEISCAEFTVNMLVALGKCTDTDVEAIVEKFRDLDKNQTNTVAFTDMQVALDEWHDALEMCGASPMGSDGFLTQMNRYSSARTLA